MVRCKPHGKHRMCHWHDSKHTASTGSVTDTIQNTWQASEVSRTRYKPYDKHMKCHGAKHATSTGSVTDKIQNTRQAPEVSRHDTKHTICTGSVTDTMQTTRQSPEVPLTRYKTHDKHRKCYWHDANHTAKTGVSMTRYKTHDKHRKCHLHVTKHTTITGSVTDKIRITRQTFGYVTDKIRTTPPNTDRVTGNIQTRDNLLEINTVVFSPTLYTYNDTTSILIG